MDWGFPFESTMVKVSVFAAADQVMVTAWLPVVKILDVKV